MSIDQRSLLELGATMKGIRTDLEERHLWSGPKKKLVRSTFGLKGRYELNSEEDTRQQRKGVVLR